MTFRTWKSYQAVTSALSLIPRKGEAMLNNITKLKGNCVIKPLMILLALSATMLSAAVVYVDENASGNADGSTWTNAYIYLQEALENASSGDEIWVAAGTYYPDDGTNQTADNRSQSFQIYDSLSVYGGFDGSEVSSDQRDPAANVTILSGEIQQNNTDSDNSYHVVMFNNNSTGTVLDGFTITGGYANSSSFPNNSGGGLYIDGQTSSDVSNLTISNCIIDGNFSSAGGGAMYNQAAYGNIAITLYNCIFRNNSATNNGGAINNNGYNAGNIQLEMINCILSGNFAGLSGGAMVNNGGNGGNCEVTMINCTTAGNHSNGGSGGGALYNKAATVSIQNSIFWGNTAAVAGDEFYNYLSTTVAVTYSIVAGSNGSGASWTSAIGTDNGNNLDADPLFAESFNASSAPTDSGDFHLTTYSPAINAGLDPAGDNNIPTTDLAGLSRPLNSGTDLGVYEYYNISPSLTSSDAVTATEDVFFIYRLTGSDPNGDEFSFAVEDLPSWLTFESDTISGTPVHGTSDTSFVVIVSDASLSDTTVVMVTVIQVNDAPVLTSATSASATEDIAFTYTATATDEESSNLTYSFTNLPTWLTANASTVTGTPTEGIGDTSFTVTVSDGDLTDSQVVTVTVTAVNDAPQITSASTAAATEDQEFTYTAAGVDPEGASLVWTFSNLPTWLTNDLNTVHGTPLHGHSDTSFTIIASDGDLTDTLEVTVTVTQVNDAPVLTSATSASATEDIAFTYTATATDEESDQLTYSFTNLPTWLTASATSVTGTPTEGIGDTSFTVTVSDGDLTDSQIVTVTVTAVNDAPVLTSSSSVTATEDQAFTYTATATDAENDQLSFTFSNLPSWLASGTDNVSGTPAYGDSDTLFTVVVSDGSLTDTLEVTVTVTQVNDAPVLTSATSVSATEDETFTYTATATDEESDQLTYSFTNLPNWLTVSATSVTGIPTEGIGDTSFTVTVSDGDLTDSQVVTVTVTAVNDAPVITSPNAVSAIEDQFFVYQATALDAETDEINFSFVDLPVWLTAVNDSVSGMPLYGMVDTSFVVIASDGELSDTLVVTLGVIQVNEPPQITSADSVAAFEDQYFVYQAQAVDEETPELTFIFTDLPHWLSVETDSVYGTPVEGFTDTSFQVIASDGELSDTLHVTLIANAINDAPQIANPGDINCPEDDSVTVVLVYNDPDNTDLILTVIPDTSAIEYHVAADTLLTLGAEVNWFGTSLIQLIVSDGELADTTAFTLSIDPVNDAPEPFTLLSPADGWYNNDQPVFNLLWEASHDVDGDTLTYLLELVADGLDTTLASDTAGYQVDVAQLTLPRDVDITWTVNATDGSDTTTSTTSWIFSIATGLAVDPLAALPQEYALQQNYPNPFNPATTIKYQLPETGWVSLVIYDLLGRQVIELVDQIEETGYKSIRWDGTNRYGHPVSAGVYIYRLQTDTYSKTRKMILLK